MRRWAGAKCIAFALACAVAPCASPVFAATPSSCANVPVSTATWVVRITAVRKLSDRTDIGIAWKNLTRKPLKPSERPNGDIGYTGLQLEYAGADSSGILDAADDHPERAHVADLLTHVVAPGATYATTLHFYYPKYFTTVMRNRRPAAFDATNGTGEGLEAIRIRLDCIKPAR